MVNFPFRLGTSSYIIPDDLLPNARYLAGQAQDIELVLFELDDGPRNLPDDSLQAQLYRLADEHRLTYTVHLPLDLKLAAAGEPLHLSLVKAKRVIESTRSLQPWAYVLHLDGKDVIERHPPQDKLNWNRQAELALARVSAWAGDPALLAVENLENYPLDFWDDVIAASGASRCIDIGHLWLNEQDPIAFMADRLQQTRVIHIHGIDDRDHKSLAHVPSEELLRVFDFLIARQYRGVVTVEVFNQPDWLSSLESIHHLYGA